MNALHDIRVVELGEGVALGYVGALLAACGADVIKIEPPGHGDSVRRLPPFKPGVAEPEASGMHAFLSANKSSVALDLHAPADLEKALGLCAKADVVVEALGPGEADRLGIGFAQIKASNPAIIVTALSWFGQDGPRCDWAATDAICQALSGFLYPIGEKDGPPLIPGGYQAQITGGMTAFIATMIALVGNLRNPKAVLIDQSILEAQATYTENGGVRAAYEDVPSVRKGLNKFTPTYPQTLYPTVDGWIGVTVLTPLQWRNCCDMIGAPHLIDDPRFNTSQVRMERMDELEAVLMPLFQMKPALYWFHEGQARRVPLAIVPTMAELATLDHYAERGVIAEYSHPDLGVFTAPTIPWKLAGTPLKRGGAAPRLGQSDGSIPNAWVDRKTVVSNDPTKDSNAKPLEGMCIVDLTMGWSGPLATRHLGDMGAEVVKIESEGYPDWWRGWEHTPESRAAQVHEKNPAFNQMNRNKFGVTIDLTKPEGQEIALRLIAGADAVIENQATGVMEKLGLTFERMKVANPSIIWLSLPAYGAEGPWSGYRGYGSTVEHGTGLPYLTGNPDGPPVQTHVAYGDACGGLNAVSALLVALFHRQRTGEGQRLEISQVECLLQVGAHGPIAQGLTGTPPVRTGNRHPVFTPHGGFPCQEEDSWLVVAVTTDLMWQSLCRVMGRSDLAERPDLATADGRRADEASIETAVSAWTQTMNAEIAMQALQEAGVAAATVRRPSELLKDENFVARGFWQELDRAVVGVKPHPLTPYRFNGERGEIRRPAPLLGEHNNMVFGQMLGFSNSEIEVLEKQAIIGGSA